MPLIGSGEIAAKLGVGVHRVNQLARADNGPNDFPQPITVIAGGIRVWDETEIDAWIEHRRTQRPALRGVAKLGDQ